MDLGIRGRRGDRLRRLEGARARLRRGAGRPRGSTSSSTPAAPRRWRRRRRRSASAHGVAVTAVAGDITTRGRAGGGAGGGAGARHPRHQRRRAAAGHLVGLEPRRLHQGDRRQHADADRADAGGAAGDDRSAAGGGSSTSPRGAVKAPIAGARALEHRAGRADRLRRRHQPAGGAEGGDDQQPAAGHPRHRPGRLRSTAAVVEAKGIDLEAARAQRAATIPARRYGTPEEFGAACAFLCSVHAGFIVGQNIDAPLPYRHAGVP